MEEVLSAPHTPAVAEGFVGFGKKPGRISPRYETPPGTPPPPYAYDYAYNEVRETLKARKKIPCIHSRRSQTQFPSFCCISLVPFPLRLFFLSLPSPN